MQVVRQCPGQFRRCFTGPANINCPGASAAVAPLKPTPFTPHPCFPFETHPGVPSSLIKLKVGPPRGRLTIYMQISFRVSPNYRPDRNWSSWDSLLITPHIICVWNILVFSTLTAVLNYCYTYSKPDTPDSFIIMKPCVVILQSD